jgi:hypothetical protein
VRIIRASSSLKRRRPCDILAQVQATWVRFAAEHALLILNPYPINSIRTSPEALADAVPARKMIHHFNSLTENVGFLTWNPPLSMVRAALRVMGFWQSIEFVRECRRHG